MTDGSRPGLGTSVLAFLAGLIVIGCLGAILVAATIWLVRALV